MKYFTIVSLTLMTSLASAQETPVKTSEYKMLEITCNSYSKPQPSDLYTPLATTTLENQNTYDDVSRNLGLSIQYSQMNFLKNSGIEFGIGIELMKMSSKFNFTLPTSPESSQVTLSSIRSNIATINLPLYYVHRFELGKNLTLFPKIGINSKILIDHPTSERGNYTDNENKLTYTVEYLSEHDFTHFPLENVFFNGTIGASLGWTTKKGAMFGLSFALSTQLFSNTIITQINDLTYTKDGEVAFDLRESNMSAFQAKNKTSNISFGISYIFGKK